MNWDMSCGDYRCLCLNGGNLGWCLGGVRDSLAMWLGVLGGYLGIISLRYYFIEIQVQVQSGTVRYSQVQSGTVRYSQVQSGTRRY
jgi:hypothetical protein